MSPRGLSGAGHRSERTRSRITFIAFVAPALLWFGLFMLWPLANMFHISTLRWQGLLAPTEAVGLDNYARMLQDQHFGNAVRNTLVHALISLPGVIAPAFMLGFFLSMRPRGFRLLRVLFFLPAMISVVALGMTLLGVYLPDGILNTVLRFVGLDGLTRLWLGDRTTALAAIISIDFWQGIGFYAVILAAALPDPRSEVYEAATLDGAGPWTVMWRIAFPLTKGFIGIVAVLHFLWILIGSSQNVLLLTNGGPGDYSLTVGYYLYDQAFLSKSLGYSQAIGVFILAVGITGLYLIRRIFGVSQRMVV